MSRPIRKLGWPCVNLLLVLALLSTAVSIIDTSHRCRQMYSQLQTMESRRWTMQEQWGRLLLEQSTWAGHHRVEQLARKELRMRLPDPAEFTVVMP